MSTADTVTTLTLGRGESVACVVSVEPGTGHTRYKLRGTRAHGVVTVIPIYDGDNVNPFTRRVRMQLGDCAKDHAVVADHDRDHLLTVNAVELGGALNVDITRVPAVDPFDAHPSDLGLAYVGAYLVRLGGGEVPDLTRRRLAALFGVIIDHWRSDPGNPAVRIESARYAVRTGGYLARKATAIRERRELLAEVQAELDRHTAEYTRMELLRDSTDPDSAGPDSADPDSAA